jgi:hypothetical protein
MPSDCHPHRQSSALFATDAGTVRRPLVEAQRRICSEVAALIGDVSDKMGKHYTRRVEAEISIIRAFDRLKDKQ